MTQHAPPVRPVQAGRRASLLTGEGSIPGYCRGGQSSSIDESNDDEVLLDTGYRTQVQINSLWSSCTDPIVPRGRQSRTELPVALANALPAADVAT